MAAEYNFPEIVKGDTFRARSIWIEEDGEPLNLTGATICMQLKTSANARPAHEMEILITDAEQGEITLREWDVYLYPQNYMYDLKITFSDGTTYTFLKGFFPVTQNISKCTI